MEHTHGKITFGKSDKAVIIIGQERRDYIASVQIQQIGGGTIAKVMESKRLANAEHLVKCWNAFEKDGIVDALLAACEGIVSLLAEVAKMNIRPFPFSAVELNKKAKAAIAAAQIGSG